MSAPQARPARVRAPQRSPRPLNTPDTPSISPNNDAGDSDEIRALRRKFGDKLATLKELFPNWTDEDLLSVLSDVNGSVEVAVGRISEGHAEQWGSVTRKKDRKGASNAVSNTTPSFSRENSNRELSRGGGRGGRGGGLAGRGSRGGGRGGRPARDQNGHRATHSLAGTPVQNAGDTWGSSTPPNEPVNGDAWGATTTATTEAWGETSANSTDVWGGTSATTAPTETKTASVGADLPAAAPEAKTNGVATETETAPPAVPAVPAAAPPTKPSSRVPAGTKLSWAQITRPKEQPKPIPLPPAPSQAPIPTLPAPAPASVAEPSREPTPQPEPQGWEDPTTAQPPTWDDDPAQNQWNNVISSSDTVDASRQTAELWQDPAIVSVSSSAPKAAEPFTPPTNSLPSQEATPAAPSESLAPTPSITDASTVDSTPPGLPTPTTSKPSTPSVKPSAAAAARNARYKSDQPVIMPGHIGIGTSSLNFGTSGIGAGLDRFGMQFGSLTLGSEDDLDSSFKPESSPEPPRESETVPVPQSAQVAQEAPVQPLQSSPQVSQAPVATTQPTQLPAQAQTTQQTQVQQEASLPSATPSLPTQLSQAQPVQAQLHQQQQPQSVANLYPQSSQQTQQHHVSPAAHSQTAQGLTTNPSHYATPPTIPTTHQQQPAQPQQQVPPHAYSQQHVQHSQQHSIDSRLGHPSAHSSYYRGPEPAYYNSPSMPPSSQPPQQDVSSPYGDFSPLGQGQATHLGGFNNSPAPIDYSLYGDQPRASYYESYGQGATTFQGRNGSLNHEDVNKSLLPSQLQSSTGLQQQSTANQGQAQNGPPLAPGQAAQPPPAGQGQPQYPGMPPISYYYPQPYSQTPYYGQYGAYPPPQPQYMKYQAVYQHAPGSSPAPPQQQPNKPPNTVAPVASYGTNQSQHLYHPSQHGYDEYGQQSTASLVDPYQKQQQPLYGQGLQNFLGLPSGAPGAAGSTSGNTQQSTGQQRGGGPTSSPEGAYKPYGATTSGATNSGVQDKTQQSQQGSQSGRGAGVTGAGVPQQQQQQQQQGQAQQASGNYFPSRYAQQPAQTGARSYAPPEQTQYYQQYSTPYWQ